MIETASKRIYVAGPMTGVPQFNFPAFDAMAESLRAEGHDVVSPAEMDDPASKAMALASPDGSPGSGSNNGETWGDFLARDVKIIADGGIEAIVVLPGWEQSRGARLETFVAFMKGIPVYRKTKYALTYIPTRVLVEAWTAMRLDEVWSHIQV